jgi:hypothetical protein
MSPRNLCNILCSNHFNLVGTWLGISISGSVSGTQVRTAISENKIV